MGNPRGIVVDSPLGRQTTDTAGAAVGVARMDADKAYVGTGTFLQEYINNADQKAWDQIKARIDYTFENLDYALGPLNEETGFDQELSARLARGQKLLFKPNLVSISCINPQTHAPDNGSTTCTEWTFIAALMRWFHDKLGIGYHQMAIGEAATTMSSVASQYSLLNPEGRRVTTEAVIEGRSGSFYGGWGFYFARQYLAETHDPGHGDDPMQGYAESVSGTYIPPGHVSDKLMVYDLNRIFDDLSKGRDVPISDGINFPAITLHKVVVGGDPADGEDRRAYPGCILINVPKFKVHNIALFTNVIKNLGIGLYPMQAAAGNGYDWKYAVPHNPVPGMKGGIPHQVWVPEMDMETGLPKRNGSGGYIVRKTGGLPATMVDIIGAVVEQDILMLHIVDGIEAINLDHTGGMPGLKTPEGMVFAGLDPVATDLLCARYMFSNVPLEEALRVDLVDQAGGHFPQRVPVPAVEGSNIVTRAGYDCLLSRDISFEHAEKRGLGQREYHVVGRDVVADAPLVSLQGHLGTASNGLFKDLVTANLFFDALKFPWDMQQTVFMYWEAVDKLTGSDLKKQFLSAFDEDGDGIVTMEDFGRPGVVGCFLVLGGASTSLSGTELLGHLRGAFKSGATSLKCADKSWNLDEHQLYKEFGLSAVTFLAYRMSQMETEAPDPFFPSLTWGKGKWPSFQLASYLQTGMRLYGPEFPNKVGVFGLYGVVFRHADATQNDAGYTGRIRSVPNAEATSKYVSDVVSGKAKPLDFVIYMPPGYGTVGGIRVPNVEETADPAKLLSASFDGGKEVWSVEREREEVPLKG